MPVDLTAVDSDGAITRRTRMKRRDRNDYRCIDDYVFCQGSAVLVTYPSLIWFNPFLLEPIKRSLLSDEKKRSPAFLRIIRDEGSCCRYSVMASAMILHLRHQRACIP